MSCFRRMQNICRITGSADCEKHVAGVTKTHYLLSKCILGILVVGEGRMKSGKRGKRDGWKRAMQVGGKVRAQFFSQFGIEGTISIEALDEFARYVFAVGATATITAQQEFVAVTKASEQGVVGEPNTLCAAFQFRCSPYHPFDRVHVERNKISGDLSKKQCF